MKVEAAPTAVGSSTNLVMTGNCSLQEYFYRTYYDGKSAVVARKTLLATYPAEKNGQVMTYYARVGNSGRKGLTIDEQKGTDLYVFWCSALDRSASSKGTNRDYQIPYGGAYTKNGNGPFYNTFGYGIQPRELDKYNYKDRNEKLFYNEKLILWIAGSDKYKRYYQCEGPKAEHMSSVGSFWFATEGGARASAGACTVYYARYSTLYNLIKNNPGVFQLKAPNYIHPNPYYELFTNGLPSIRKASMWGPILTTQNEVNAGFCSKSAFGRDMDYLKQNMNHEIAFEVAQGLDIVARVGDNYRGKTASV